MVCNGSRAAVAGKPMARPVYPQLRIYPCVTALTLRAKINQASSGEARYDRLGEPPHVLARTLAEQQHIGHTMRLQLLPQFQSTSVARGRQPADLISFRLPYFASRTIGAAEQDHRLRRGETVRQSTMCPPSQILRRRDAR